MPGYFISKYSDFNKINKDVDQEERFLGLRMQKKLKVDRKLGMSSDFPMNTGVYHKIAKESRSIFNQDYDHIEVQQGLIFK